MTAYSNSSSATRDSAPTALPSSVDIMVRIPELDKTNPVWLRGYGLQATAADLYHACVNLPELRAYHAMLDRHQASRHFWLGDKMLRRDAVLSQVLEGAGGLGGNREITLILRRDQYRLSPPQLVSGGASALYLDAEAPIEHVVAGILTQDECPDCFDLCDAQGKHLARERSLADYALWPGWPDAPADAFPVHAQLQLRPRPAWLPRILYALALILGILAGYALLAALLASPH